MILVQCEFDGAITEEDERRRVLTRLKEASPFRQGQPMEDVEEWVRGSCLIEVTLG